jgi:hypothetical protein
MVLRKDQNGLIPMIITLLALVIGVIVIAYLRVKANQG